MRLDLLVRSWTTISSLSYVFIQVAYDDFILFSSAQDHYLSVTKKLSTVYLPTYGTQQERIPIICSSMMMSTTIELSLTVRGTFSFNSLTIVYQQFNSYLLSLLFIHCTIINFTLLLVFSVHIHVQVKILQIHK